MYIQFFGYRSGLIEKYSPFLFVKTTEEYNTTNATQRNTLHFWQERRKKMVWECKVFGFFFCKQMVKTLLVVECLAHLNWYEIFEGATLDDEPVIVEQAEWDDLTYVV